jgi:hypothetical protein
MLFSLTGDNDSGRAAAFAALVCALFGCIGLGGCQHLNFARGETAPEKAPACLGEVKDLRAKKFGLEGSLEERVHTTFAGVLHLEETAIKLDDRLAEVCESMARGLGVDNPEVKPQATLGVRTELACKKAIEKLKAVKEKHSVALAIDAKQFDCGVRPDDFAACAKQCDGNLPPGNSEVSCEEGKLRGRCTGKCTGECGQTNTTGCASTCEGECNGSCNKGFYGHCGGKCIGTCDMANVNGKCAGMCDGKCLSDAQGTCEGTCKGKCNGNCTKDVKKAACDGTCTGACDATMAAAICSETLPPPEMSPDCVAMCGAAMTSKLQCTSAHVGVALVRAEKESEGKRVQNALSGRLKDVLEIGDGMKLPLESAAAKVSEALESLKTDLAEDSASAKKANSCLQEAISKKDAATAAFTKLSEVSAAVFEAARN